MYFPLTRFMFFVGEFIVKPFYPIRVLTKRSYLIFPLDPIQVLTKIFNFDVPFDMIQLLIG